MLPAALGSLWAAVLSPLWSSRRLGLIAAMGRREKGTTEIRLRFVFYGKYFPNFFLFEGKRTPTVKLISRFVSPILSGIFYVLQRIFDPFFVYNFHRSLLFQLFFSDCFLVIQWQLNLLNENLNENNVVVNSKLFPFLLYYCLGTEHMWSISPLISRVWGFF